MSIFAKGLFKFNNVIRKCLYIVMMFILELEIYISLKLIYKLPCYLFTKQVNKDNLDTFYFSSLKVSIFIVSFISTFSKIIIFINSHLINILNYINQKLVSNFKLNIKNEYYEEEDFNTLYVDNYIIKRVYDGQQMIDFLKFSERYKSIYIRLNFLNFMRIKMHS